MSEHDHRLLELKLPFFVHSGKLMLEGRSFARGVVDVTEELPCFELVLVVVVHLSERLLVFDLVLGSLSLNLQRCDLLVDHRETLQYLNN